MFGHLYAIVAFNLDHQPHPLIGDSKENFSQLLPMRNHDIITHALKVCIASSALRNGEENTGNTWTPSGRQNT
jgi:hypothetical protein